MRQFVKYSGIIAVSLMLASCGGGILKADKPETDEEVLLGQEGRTLWETGLQYVKIVDQDVSTFPNEHPEVMSSEELRTVLGSLYAREESLFKDEDIPLFSRGELQILSTTISSGLSQAGPSEDIDFVSIGAFEGSFAKERKTNTGRVFMSGGRLNIIFGLIQVEYTELDKHTNQPIDRRLHPLVPGTRKSESKLTTNIALDSGQSFYIDPETGTERTDWIVIDIATVLRLAAERGSADDGSLSPELREDIARSKQETGNLRHDVSNIKEILFELSDDIEQLRKQIEELNAKP